MNPVLQVFQTNECEFNLCVYLTLRSWLAEANPT
jgi:hypothetical protein